MTQTQRREYPDGPVPELDDFRPHRFDPMDEPQTPPGDAPLPEFILCVAGHGVPPGRLPSSIRPLAELLYRIEEALLARAPRVRRALCCGTQVRPLEEITRPDELPTGLFLQRSGWQPMLLHTLSEACALTESIPSVPGVPTRLLLLTDLAPDALALPMLRLLLDRLHGARPGLCAALVHCGEDQTAWAARLRELEQRTGRSIPLVLPDELYRLSDFLFPGGDA